MAKSEAILNEQQELSPVTPPLFCASDDVLLMVLERTSAIDVARMSQVNKELHRRVTAYVHRIANALIKAEGLRLTLDVAYLDFYTLDTAHAIERYVNFFGLTYADRWWKELWPFWCDAFCNLYCDTDSRNTRLREFTCLYEAHTARHLHARYVHGLIKSDGTLPWHIAPLLDTWTDALVRGGYEHNPGGLLGFFIDGMVQWLGGRKNRVAEMFVYASKNDVFGEEEIFGGRCEKSAGRLIEKEDYKDRKHGAHHVHVNACGQTGVPYLDVDHTPLRYYSKSRHKGLAAAARKGFDFGKEEIAERLSPLVFAAVAEDTGVCQLID